MAARKIEDRWTVDFHFRFPDGSRKRIREQSPVNTKRGAEEHERLLRTALLEGRRGKTPPAEVPTLAEFWTRWIEGHGKANRQKPSTLASKESIYKHHLGPYLGKKRLDAISEEDVQRIKGRLVKHSPKTVNNVLSVLAKCLKTAVKWKVIPRLPVDVELVKAPPATMTFYQEHEFARLAEAAEKLGPTRLVFLLLAGEAGLRAGEIMALEWPQVDLRNRTLTVKHSLSKGELVAPKGGRARTVPMTSRLAEALQAARHLRGPRVLYRDGRRNAGKATSQKTLQVWMEGIQRRAGLKETGQLHILRHTFCSRLAMKGAPAKAIQELAGHVHLTTTQRYMHLSPSARDGAIRLLEGDSVWAVVGQQGDPENPKARNH